MAIQIEFYGIARSRAGREEIQVQASTAVEALDLAVAAIPELASCYDADDGLKPGFILNLNGKRFLSDLGTPIADGDALLLLSADAGG